MTETTTEQLVWVEDRSFRLVPVDDGKLCRMKGCRAPAVAEFQRLRSLRRPDPVTGSLWGKAWWAYCADHLYGRRIEGDKVVIGVAPGSPAAMRGYVE